MSTYSPHILSASSAPKLSGPDGPYAKFEQNRLELIFVDKAGNVLRESRGLKFNSIICKVDNYSEDSFVISLNAPFHFEQPVSEYSASRSIAVISDIEGNFDAFYRLLLSNEIINSDFEWIFNDNDLVILGDVTDKGPNV